MQPSFIPYLLPCHNCLQAEKARQAEADKAAREAERAAREAEKAAKAAVRAAEAEDKAKLKAEDEKVCHYIACVLGSTCL